MSVMFPVRWFTRFGLSALVLLLACGLATAWFGSAPQLPSTATRDGTLITLNRYATEPIPDVVLTGSSLTFRLKEEYFATPRLRNLGIAGGSPVTGLEIVANQPRLPKIILVEANILSRQTDAALVEQYSKRGSTEPLLFRPIRTAVATYEHWRHAPLTHAQVSLALGRLLALAPNDLDNRIYVERALQQENSEDPTTQSHKNVKRIEELIETIEQRGAQVLLFEAPVSAELEQSRFARITREIAHTKFPDSNRWLRVVFRRSELRWTDGAHLDERSALIFASALDEAIAKKLPMAN
jgi:hypothetical protein